MQSLERRFRIWSRSGTSLLIGLLMQLSSAFANTPVQYKADWASLGSYPMPNWLVEAKFGIYAHWGVYSVPAFQDEWYAKHMYEKDSPAYQHHVEKYGEPSRFGYKDFVPMFRAEKFDPDEWAQLIQASGARYAGMAVVHHDGFLMWDSDVNRWNAKRMGPKRDLYGDLLAALRRIGLKTIATEHHLRTYNWYAPGGGALGGSLKNPADAAALIKAEGWDLMDPAYADLYWNELSGRTYEQFLVEWQAEVREVIDKYKPDILWFDGGNFRGTESENIVLDLLAHYHNRATEWATPVAVLNKMAGNRKWNFPEGYGIATYEEGRDRGSKAQAPWIDDMKIADIGWCYVEGQKYKPAREIIAGLADRVSRGGGLLLNISPKADGTIPEGQKNSLLGVGKWLKTNGEAIYGSQPWVVTAEGDESRLIQKNRRWEYADCNAADIRYTQPKDAGCVYAILLGWPGAGQTVTLKAVNATNHPKTIERIELLGGTNRLAFEQHPDGLKITMPSSAPDFVDGNPCVLKIVSVHP